MNARPGTPWAVVLAAGEGTRLRCLTTDSSGRSTPKQYCSLFGGPSLLQDALTRGAALADPGRLCAIVAAEHHAWWRTALGALSPDNVISQPRNRGTANGVLLALLTVLARDPQAHIVFLPADHYVADETRLATAMRSALDAATATPDALILLGIAPEEADPELGYIMPRTGLPGLPRVERFVEKPPAAVACDLIARGALWNSFIFAARGGALLDVYQRSMPEVVDAMRAAIADHGDAELHALYDLLPTTDFSRHVLEGIEERLRMVAAPACGWTDLGTARRVREAVRRIGAAVGRRLDHDQLVGPAPITLADALPQLRFAT